MTCTLFGQVDIYLSGSLEIVLEGEIGPVELDGLIDIKKRGAQNIYLEGVLNDPNLEGTLETIVNLEGCLIVDKDPPLVTPTASAAPDAPIECDDNIIANESGSAKLFKFEVELGSGTGFYGIDWFMGGYIPDRFVVFWDGNTVIDTGWVGPTNAYQVPTGTFNYNVFDTYTYNAPYINFGSSSGTQSVTITSSDINLGVGTSGLETFNKTASSPTTMQVWVYSHPTNNGTVWQLQPNCAPGISQTPTVTPTLTPTMSITPTLTPTVTPTSSVGWDYFSAPTLCCDSTDTPITGNIAILSSYGFDGGEITILNGHAYTLGTKQTAVGDETYITDITGLFGTCEQAVGYAVYLSGETSGCRYTFSGCCGTESLFYTEPFSIQGANPSSFAVIDNWILNAPYGILYTGSIATNDINVCATLRDYNSSVTIDNTELNNFNTTDVGYNCGQNRCSRCAYIVEPCSDPGTYLRWVVNPSVLYDYEIGDVFSGSNINGYQVSSSTYEITGHCLSIVDSTSTPIVGGAVFTVIDGYSPGDQQYGTHTSISSCSNDNCAECYTNFTIQNYNSTVAYVTYTSCNGVSGYVYVPGASMGQPYGQITVTNCVIESSINLPANTGIVGSWDYCE